MWMTLTNHTIPSNLALHQTHGNGKRKQTRDNSLCAIIKDASSFSATEKIHLPSKSPVWFFQPLYTIVVKTAANICPLTDGPHTSSSFSSSSLSTRRRAPPRRPGAATPRIRRQALLTGPALDAFRHLRVAAPSPALPFLSRRSSPLPPRRRVRVPERTAGAAEPRGGECDTPPPPAPSRRTRWWPTLPLRRRTDGADARSRSMAGRRACCRALRADDGAGQPAAQPP